MVFVNPVTNLKFIKEVRLTLKRIARYLAKKLLATLFSGSICYYLCLFIQTQFQLGKYIHVCTKEILFLASLQYLMPTLAGIMDDIPYL